jgi:trafficking protein particle complex subunit 6
MSGKNSKVLVSLSAYEYLLREVLFYESPKSPTKLKKEEGGEDKSTSSSSVLSFDSYNFQVVDKMGYDVGYRLMEKALLTEKFLGLEELDYMKFICKDFWEELYGKKIDKLQTNHKGVFVLYDNSFRWLERHASNDEETNQAAIKLLNFPCGILRGALANLGLSAIVNADFTALPSVKFNIVIKN